MRLGRPLFLIGGVLFNALGVTVALYQGARFDLAIFLWGQLAITAVQLSTHFSNDYFDLEADKANQTPSRWSGGSRVLPDDLLPPRVALYAALLTTATALVATAVLSRLQPAPLTVPLLLLALALSWAYSAPPFRLHSRGLGELTVALIVPVLTPLVGYYLQAGRASSVLLLAVLPLALLQVAMILVINFPDAAGDRLSGKRTLVIRLGPDRAARLCMGLWAGAYLALPLAVLLGLPALAALALALPAPLALWQIGRVGRGDWRNPLRWNSLAFWSIGLLMASAGLELLAFAALVWLA